MNPRRVHKGEALAKNGPHGNEEEEERRQWHPASCRFDSLFDEESEESKITPAQVYWLALDLADSFTSSTKALSKPFGTVLSLKA